MKEDLNQDGKVTMQEKILAALASYGRHFLGAAKVHLDLPKRYNLSK